MCQTSDLIIVNFDALHWNNFLMTLKSSKRNWKTITFPFLSIYNKQTKKETKLIVDCILVSLVCLTYSYFRFLLSKIDLYCLSVVINLEYLFNKPTFWNNQAGQKFLWKKINNCTWLKKCRGLKKGGKFGLPFSPSFHNLDFLKIP